MNPTLSTRLEVKTIAALALAHGLVATTASHAQSTPSASSSAGSTDDLVKLPEMTVEGEKQRPLSSPKFTAPLLDTPQTISVIPREVFLQQGGATLSDVMRNTPGITFLAGEGGNASSADGDSFFLRGFDASNSIFIDGVRDTGQYQRDVFNIEQVEIAKGPAGADIGRGSASGYVNMATKVPGLDAFQAGSLSYGSEDRVRATIDVNQPIADTTAAVRLNAMWQDGGVAGRDIAEDNRWAFAPSLTLGLGKPTRLHLAYQHLKYDDLPDYGLPRAAMPVPGGRDSYTPLPPPVDQDTFYGSVQDFDHVSSDVYFARVEHDFSPTTRISNQTRLSQTDRLAFLTPPTNYTAATGIVARARQGNQRENEAVSNLTNFLTQFQTGEIRHSFSSGFEYVYETQLTTSYTSTQGTNAANPLYDPNLPTPLVTPDNTTPLLDPVPSGASNRGEIDTYALYAFDSIRLGEQWQATLGGRWETYDGRYRSTAANGTVSILDTDDDHLSWKAGLAYKPAPNGNIYAAYGTSFRPPGANFTTGTGTSADNVVAEPQEARNFEIGAKWDFFQNRLSTNLALFDSTNTNVTVATDPVTGDPVQTGDQNVKGIEVGLSGRINANWMVFGGFAYLDTENSNPSQGATNDGAQIQWTPEFSGNFWTTYRLPIGLTLGGGGQYMDQTARQTTNNPAAALPETPSYWVFNFLATYPVNEHITLRLNINNVFDEFYLQSLNNNANRYNPGTPRSFLLSADWSF